MSTEALRQPPTEAPTKAVIQDRSFEGERPLYAIEDTRLERVRFLPGESPLKHARGVDARECTFLGKYPLWHADEIDLEDCLFTVSARAAVWYSQRLRLRNVRVEAPKMFRQTRDLLIERSRFSNAAETLWTCANVTLRDVQLEGADYVFMNGRDLRLDDVQLQGNYSFQDARNVVIRSSHLASKDAFWGTENVTVYDSVLEGEYLGWHSKNLRLVNCTIRGTQPLCYATDLVMVGCRMEETDLCFEHSTLEATIESHVASIRNPTGGSIRARGVGLVIFDEHCLRPGGCAILTDQQEAC